MTERSAVHLAGVSHSWPPVPAQTPTSTPSTCGHLCPPRPALLLCAARRSEASLILALGRPVTRPVGGAGSGTWETGFPGERQKQSLKISTLPSPLHLRHLTGEEI